ncbi:MAG: hypothetical protein E7613_06810 [Ruminococcaceae bacterium]|nr:hypothetical protein [Oscillospiraceae bacterium]
MKKLVCLLVALCLTAALFSCTDAPKTKQEEETPTETATPNEIASPSENDTTTPETVTPTEPDEPTEEPDENVVMLPEADENTKYITIEFPKDFPEEPYAELNLVSPEEFEWGEYGLFVRVENTAYGEIGKPTYTYAFLGEFCDIIEKGKNI